ncbi:MAG: TIGR02757 family protein [Cryomorphaceae bacterium]|jgi:uncharacterized protein (TIGR02757 family)|nr:TIGR02757 family protein [Cryomorphaceae bacterium]
MNQTELKEFLDYKADTFENSSFLESDPITLPHRFQNKEDIEITAFLIATIAWGNRKSIIQSGERILEIMEYQPKEFILSFDSQNKLNSRFVHRTFNSEDLHYFFARLNHIYKEGGLEHSFRKSKPNDTVKERIHLFRTRFFGNDTEHRSFKHVSDPMKNSAAKRLNMFLRWMVRDSSRGVDFGIWKNFQSSELYIPLDVHTGNVARKLGLLSRKQDDWKALEELMTELRKMDSNDPVKYDFALFGLGAFESF